MSGNKPKICFISAGLDLFKGGGYYLADIMPRLKNDFDIMLLTGYLNTRGEKLDYDIRIIKTRRFPYYYGLYDYFFARNAVKYLKSIIKKERIDIIHLNQIVGSPILKLKKLNIPIVYTVHHPASADRSIAVEESKCLKEKLIWKIKYFLIIRAQKKIVRNFDNILTVSNRAAERVARDYKIPLSKIKVIYNGINVSLFMSRGTETKKENAVISVGSYLHPRKGFKYLFEVYKKLDKHGGIRIFDVGRRSKEQIEQLKTLRNIEIFGTVSYDEMVRLYSKSKVYISTSLYEGFGFSLIEAMSCGTPALAFSVGGTSEVLDKISPELKIAPRNTEQMAKKVLEIMNDPRFPEKAEIYRQKVKENFDLEKIYKEFKNLYFQVLNIN